MKKPSYPDHVKIGAHNYEIRWQDDADMDNSGKFGSCNRHLMVIYLPSPDALIASMALEVLFHELAHAVLYHFSGIEDMDSMTEEQIASAFGFGMATVFLDNPGLIDFVKYLRA